MAERLTQADYAERKGVSRARISQLVKDGRLRVDADGLLNVDESDAAWNTLLDFTRATRERAEVLSAAGPPEQHASADPPGDAQEPPEPEGTESAVNHASELWAYKKARERLALRREELDLDQREGKLTRIDEVERSRVETSRRLASVLRNLPARCAPLCNPADPDRAYAVLEQEINRALLELAADLENVADVEASSEHRDNVAGERYYHGQLTEWGKSEESVAAASVA